MPWDRPGKKQEAETALLSLDFTGYAQEFLRRNQTYRAQHALLVSERATKSRSATEEMAQSWGLMFPCNPDRPALKNPAIWLAEHAPAILTLVPATDRPEALTFERIAAGRHILLDRTHSRGRHVYFASATGLQRLWFPEPDKYSGFACKVLISSDLGTRIEALGSFHASLSHALRAERAGLLQPTRFQRYRLSLMLDVLDHLAVADASSPVRSVATHVAFPRTRFASAAEWKGSSERRQTQRLIDQARSLAAGGYRDLLIGCIPSQGC